MLNLIGRSRRLCVAVAESMGWLTMVDQGVIDAYWGRQPLIFRRLDDSPRDVWTGLNAFFAVILRDTASFAGLIFVLFLLEKMADSLLLAQVKREFLHFLNRIWLLAAYTFFVFHLIRRGIRIYHDTKVMQVPKENAKHETHNA